MGPGSTYDVFFSYNGVDKAEVELLATRLQREAGLLPFLDKWHLVPGEPWQPELERAIEQSSTAAIFFGPQGRGPWHIEEMQVLLDKAARSRNDFRVIPVLLPGASAEALDAFLKQRTWVDFRSRLDDLSAFQRLVAGIKGEATEPNGYELPDEPAPYRGLERFEADQKDFFFGREDDIRRLARRLAHSRFVAIVGASGCGKSSLARAGLHSDVASRELPAIRDWHLITFLPGGNPLRALAEQIAGEAPVADRVRIADELAERFESRGDGLCTAIGALTAGNRRTVLIVVDQFEEIFTHSGITRDSASNSSSRAEQLISNLFNAVEDPSGSFRVLITLRADFVPHSLEFPQLRYLLENNQLLLGELGPVALREAIKFPARKVGAFFEKGLVELILRDVHQQRGSLPLLQHALKELWQARLGPWLTLEAYEGSGGVAGALRRRAQDTYEQKLKDDLQRAIAHNVLLRLITLGEGVPDSRRRVPREELFPHGVERREVEQVLSVLSHNDARLIVINDDNTVEVTHEALIHSWETLREWIDSKREQLRVLRRLTDSAKEWEEAGRETSYLYRGGRLEDVEKWPISSEVSLNRRELLFVEASLAERHREGEQRRIQQQRELNGALKLAEAERQARRRQRKLIGALVALLFIAGLVAVIAVWESNSARLAQKETSEVACRAHVSLARDSLEAGKEAEALAHLAQALRLNPGDYAAVSLTAALLAQTNPVQRSTVVMEHDSDVVSAHFSPDGLRVLTASSDQTARQWNAAGGQPLGTPLRHLGKIESARFSPNGQRIVTGSDDGTARLWDAITGEEIGAVMQHEGPVYSAEFSPDGQRVVTASADNTARLWEALTGKPIGEPMKHEAGLYSARFSPDGRRLVTASADKTARLWDAVTGQPLGEPLKHEDSVWSAQFSPDGERVVTASWDKSARVWDAFTGQPLTISLRHEGSVLSAEFSPDGQRVITSSEDNSARVWDAATGQPLGAPLVHGGAVVSAQFSPDGRRVLTSSEDRAARVWVMVPPTSMSLEHEGGILSAHFSPDGRRIVTSSEDRTSRVWDAATGRAVGPAMRHEYVVCSAQFSPDSKWVLTASWDKTAQVWDAATSRPLSLSMKHEGSIYSAQFSPNGKWVLTGSWDKTARLWEAATGQPLGAPMKLEGSVLVAQFSPDGRRLITACDDGTARLWDARTGKPLSASLQHGDKVNSACFSPDGQWALTASADRTARLWSVNLLTSQPFGTSMKHEAAVLWAQFSPDGRRLITASDDCTARLWDARTGQPLGETMKHQRAVLSARFSSDGRRVATASDDRTTRVWDGASGQPLSPSLWHGGAIKSAEFSPDCQRVLTASEDKSARLWDLPTVTDKDTVEEIRLLADLAEATGGVALQTSAPTELLKELKPEQTGSIRARIAAAFPGLASKLTPLQRLLKWAVADYWNRTISPLSETTVDQWIENQIEEGTLDGLRAAMQVDPANARLAAHYGRRLADYSLKNEGDPAEIRRARDEADFQTHRGLQLAPDSAEVRALRVETVRLLQPAQSK